MSSRLAVLATLLVLAGCAAPQDGSADPRPDRGREQRDAQRDRDREPAAAPSEDPGASPAADAGPVTAAVYYLADTDRAGVRLYREFRRTDGPVVPATLRLLASDPLDPDYRTAWQPGQLLGVVSDGGVIEVVVDPSVRTRPAGMSEAEARAALQQVVYSLQAAAQDRLPVLFRSEEQALDQVLGVPTPRALGNAPALQTLSHISLTSPEQGSTVGGDTLQVSGVGNSFEATFGWQLRQGDRVVDEGFATMEGWMGDRLFPFETTVDVSGLEPGTYTLRVSTDDPAGGTEGIGRMTDDKDVTIP
jgi:hypothetical protein